MKLLVLPALFFSLSVSARETITVLAADVAPYAYTERGKIVGASVELVRELCQRQKINVRFQLVPFSRAYWTGQVEPGSYIIQIGRTPEREAKFSWILPLYNERFMVHVLGNSGINPDLASVGPPGPVGVLQDGLGHRLAVEMGITPIEPVADELTNARKLMAGRISAWLASYNSAQYAMRNAGFDPAQLKRGAVLRSYPLYLATAPGHSASKTARWLQTLDKMKLDGSYQRILARYQYVP